LNGPFFSRNRETEFTWSCSEQGLSSISLTTDLVSSYLRLFTLIPSRSQNETGRYFFCDTIRYYELSFMVPPLSRGALSCGVRTFLPVTIQRIV